MTSLIMSIFLKSYAKNGKIVFTKISLVTARKKTLKIFLQSLKVKITYKLNIYWLIC